MSESHLQKIICLPPLPFFLSHKLKYKNSVPAMLINSIPGSERPIKQKQSLLRMVPDLPTSLDLIPQEKNTILHIECLLIVFGTALFLMY